MRAPDVQVIFSLLRAARSPFFEMALKRGGSGQHTPTRHPAACIDKRRWRRVRVISEKGRVWVAFVLTFSLFFGWW